MTRQIRIAARALVVIEGHVLLVNAYPDFRHQLWCAPGGGGQPGEAITDTLVREVLEETGVAITPGPLAGVSEFHDPDAGFHQLDLFFHASALGVPEQGWADPERIVDRWRLVDRDELATLNHKPDHLGAMTFDAAPVAYHGLELKI